MPTLEEALKTLNAAKKPAPLTGKKNPKEKGEIFSGGTVSDVFDILQVPQFIATGALTPGVSIGEAVSKRLTPSKALGLKGFGGFAADVILDPLNFLAVLGAPAKGIKAAKEGTKAATLAAQAAQKQRALLTIGLPFTDKSATLIKGQKVLEGLTKAGQKIKSIPIGGFEKGTDTARTLGKGLESVFGAIPESRTLGVISKSLDEIEQGKKANMAIADIKKMAKRLKRAGKSEGIEDLRVVYNKVQKALKNGELDNDMFELLQRNVQRSVSGRKVAGTMNKTAQSFFDELEPLARIAKNELEGELSSILKGSGLVSVPLDDVSKTKNIALGRKVLDEVAASERQADFFRAGDKVFVGKGANVVDIATDKKFKMVKHGGKDLVLDIRQTQLGKPSEFTQYTRLTEDIKDSKNAILKFKTHLKDAKISSAKKTKLTKQLKKAQDKSNLANAELDAILSKAPERQGVLDFEVDDILESVGKKPVFKKNIFDNILATKIGGKTIKSRKIAAESIAENPALSRKLEAGELVPEGYKKFKLKELDGFIGEEQVVNALEETVMPLTNDNAVHTAIQIFDNVQNFWKKTATFVNPAFHFRNVVSNHWLQALAGVNPVDSVRGYRVMREVSKSRAAGKTGQAFMDDLARRVGRKNAELYKELAEDGNIRVGRFFGDIEQGLKKDNFLFEGGGAVGSYLEDSAKMGMYISKRKADFGAKEAAREVRKFLFDYGDLTDIERVILKRAAPFYTWSRKNIPLQLAMLIESPQKVSLIPKLKNWLEGRSGDEPLPDELVPEWMKDGYGVFLGDNPGGLKRYLRLEGFLPTVDIGNLAKPGELFAGQLSPVIKNPIELATNYDLFFNKQISEYEGHAESVFGVGAVDPRVRKMTIDLIRPIRDFERTLGLSPHDVGKEISATDRLIRFFTGINIKELDPKQQKEVLKMLTDKEINTIKREKKKLKKAGDLKGAQRLDNVLSEVKRGEREIKL